MRWIWIEARVSRRLVATVGAIALLAAASTLAASETRAQSAGDLRGLQSAVVEEMHGGASGTVSRTAAAASSGEDQVNVRRSEGEWAFGTAVVPAPNKEGAYPQGWLFVAEKAGGGWDVGLEGSPEFSELAQEAPEDVVGAEEKDLFVADDARYSKASGGTGLRLPWILDKGWTMSGGPHGWSTGYDRPYSSMDFSGGDGRVRAAGDGKAYLMCQSRRGWIRVVHAGGYATDYYHLQGNIKPANGVKRVDEGQFLGNAGTDVSCGGKAYGRHVHFALRRDGKHVAVDGRRIGGWTFQQGQAYEGSATHGKRRRTAGERLLNYG